MHSLTNHPPSSRAALLRANALPVRRGRFPRAAVVRCSGSAGGQAGFYNREVVDKLRTLLATPGLHQGPCAHDAISAKLIANAEFPFAFMSGFCVSGAKLAEPDAGLISYAEMVAQGAEICRAAGNGLPVIGDGDTGYGNALNVKRTVKGYANAGFAGILIEDQLAPKACGHTKNRRVVSRSEAVSRIRAAVDARDEGAGILINARSDARSAVSLDEALWRAQAFADEGADLLFIDALQSREEMQAFCKVAPHVPKMANMLEGGGATPICSLQELEDMGYKIVAYPLSMLGVSIRAMENALIELKAGQVPSPPTLPTFEELKQVVGFNDYYEQEERYAITLEETASSSPTPPPTPPPATPFADFEVLDADGNATGVGQQTQPPPNPYADAFLRRSGWTGRWLRLKITNADGVVQLDTRFPADFLGGLGMIPGVAGLDLESMIKDCMDKEYGSAGPSDGDGTVRLMDVTKNNQRIEVTIGDGLEQK